MKIRYIAHVPDSGQNIRIRSELNDPIDVDLLTQAIIQIAEQQLLQQQAEDFARSLAEPDSEDKEE